MTKKTQFVCTIFAMAAVSVGSVKAYSAWNEKTELPRLTVSESAASAAVSSDVNGTQTTLATSAMQTPENVANLNIPEGKPLLTTEEAVEKVLPAVVGIESEFNYTQTFQNYGFLFGRSGRQSQQQVMTGTGTGVVITDDGYIVTNAHVIYDNEHGCGLAGSINVLMGDSEKIKAELVGYDVDCDLAVLKVEGNGLAHAELGNSDDLKLGQSVVAIGNPLGFDLRNTVTAGIVSGLNRQIEISDSPMTLLQTDAAINSGNSGGPLINLYGQVIGINSSKMSASYSETSIEGIGFAIPSNEAAKIVDQLMNKGFVAGRASIGITCMTVDEDLIQNYGMEPGVYVSTVNAGGAAENAGILKGDIIVAADGVDVTSLDELNAVKNQHKAGEQMQITVSRGGQKLDLIVILDAAKAE